MNKLSFRARALDASKPMPIYMSEELPDLPEYSAINRAVPQMPSGMEKEEESVSFWVLSVACSGSHLELAPYSNFLTWTFSDFCDFLLLLLKNAAVSLDGRLRTPS